MATRASNSDQLIRLVEPLVPALRRYARALLRDKDGADDLVQDCLERVVSRWHLFDPGAQIRPWVFTILHNLAVSRLRQRQRRGIHVPIDETGDDALGRPGTQDAALLRRDLLEALKQLPEEQREVLLLVTVEELSYLEAAKILSVPLGTVMSRLSRGRERLRVLLELPGRQTGTGQPHLRRVK